MQNSTIDYVAFPFKKMTSPNNKELVTIRANIINKKSVLSFSIGTTICDLMDLNKSDRINLFSHKRDKNIYLIKKSNDKNDGYIICHSSSKNSFMTFRIRYPFIDRFRLSQTVPIDYDINDDKSLTVNIEKILWRK